MEASGAAPSAGDRRQRRVTAGTALSHIHFARCGFRGECRTKSARPFRNFIHCGTRRRRPGGAAGQAAGRRNRRAQGRPASPAANRLKLRLLVRTRRVFQFSVSRASPKGALRACPRVPQASRLREVSSAGPRRTRHGRARRPRHGKTGELKDLARTRACLDDCGN
jgi:hypothetical protein